MSSKTSQNRRIPFAEYPFRRFFAASAIGLALAGATQPLTATEDFGYLNDAIITNNALSNVKGIVGINQAAGDFNLQANVRAISEGAGSGQATTGISQVSSLAGATSADASTTSIRENAFQNMVGLLSINQASGAGNLESNAITISHERLPAELTDDLLAQTSLDVAAASERRNGGKSDGIRTVHVDKTAFRGVKGVLQLNQAAGMHNVTQNRVFMQTTP